MTIEEAKEILESIGLLDSITDELIEASGMVLDALNDSPSWHNRPAAILPEDLEPLPEMSRETIQRELARLQHEQATAGIAQAAATPSPYAATPNGYVSDTPWVVNPAWTDSPLGASSLWGSADEIIPESPIDWSELELDTD